MYTFQELLFFEVLAVRNILEVGFREGSMHFVDRHASQVPVD